MEAHDKQRAITPFHVLLVIACTTSVTSTTAFRYVYPLHLFKEEFVLTFGVRAANAAIITWSTDGTLNNIKYELGESRLDSLFGTNFILN